MRTTYGSNYVCDFDSKEARAQLANLICKMPNAPIILFVRNDEICDDGSTTAHAVDWITVNEVLQYNGRFYDDEEDFLWAYNDGQYDSLDCQEDFNERKVMEEARNIWRERAIESICVGTTGAVLPKDAVVS